MINPYDIKLTCFALGYCCKLPCSPVNKMNFDIEDHFHYDHYNNRLNKVFLFLRNLIFGRLINAN